MKENSDETIIRLVLKGETHFFGRIVERYQRPIYNLMYRYCRSEQEAADLTQDVFLRAYDRLKTFKTDKRFFPWIYGLAVNRANDWYRKNTTRRKKLIELQWDSDSPGIASEQENILLGKEEVANLYIALDELTDKTREMVLLRFQQELLISEIADIFKVTESAVKMRIARGLAKMRNQLGGNRYGRAK
jgi:RNA polymerase sigma-70 factor (ECF subfamily)